MPWKHCIRASHLKPRRTPPPDPAQIRSIHTSSKTASKTSTAKGSPLEAGDVVRHLVHGVEWKGIASSQLVAFTRGGAFRGASFPSLRTEPFCRDSQSRSLGLVEESNRRARPLSRSQWEARDVFDEKHLDECVAGAFASFPFCSYTSTPISPRFTPPSRLVAR